MSHVPLLEVNALMKVEEACIQSPIQDGFEYDVLCTTVVLNAKGEVIPESQRRRELICPGY